jgi:hypothetical protein
VEEKENMRTKTSLAAFTAVSVACVLSLSGSAWAAPDKPAATLDTAAIETLTGAKGTAGGKGQVLHADIDPAKTTLSPAKIEAVLVQTQTANHQEG